MGLKSLSDPPKRRKSKISIFRWCRIQKVTKSHEISVEYVIITKSIHLAYI